MIEMLPQLLFATQAVMYVILAWVFGSMAFRGLRKRLHFAIKIAVVFGTGFLCLVSGTVLADYMFFFKGTVFRVFQIDLLLGGIISSIIIAVAFYLITRREKVADKEGMLRKLKERVSLLEGLLLKHRVPTLREGEVRKIAESLVHGFAARHASLKKTDWEIFLEKGEKKARVVIGAYTGEVKKVEHLGAKFFSDPLRTIGVILIISLAAFSLFSFRGFPNMLEDVSSLLGMSPEQLGMFYGGENLPEGCVSVTRLLMKPGVSVFGGESSYTNEEVKAMIEKEAGFGIERMYVVDYEGKNYILAADSTFENICSATESRFCQCIKIPSSGRG